MANNQTFDKIKTNIDNYFSELEENKKFSGAILVSIKGEKVISKGYGMANYELNVPNTAKTKFRIGSITKQFTAAAILQLFEKGLLSLDDTLDKYIPDYPKGDKVTIHHLLTHSSGIFNYTDIEGYRTNIMKIRHSVEGLIEEFKDMAYNFEPGTKASYSNSGYALLGYIIEKLSNMSYQQYVQKNIFDKIFMNDSCFDEYNRLIMNRASGYILQGDVPNISNCDFIDMSLVSAAGGIYSTVEDLCIWTKALFKGEVISKESLNKMTTKHVYFDDDESYYGYGLLINDEEINGKMMKLIYHDGSISGFLSVNTIFPTEDINIVMLTNINDLDNFGGAVSNIESIIFENI